MKQMIRVIKKASMTVEAALVMPFFFLCMTALATMPDLYAKYAADAVSLQQKAEKAAKIMTGIAAEDNGGAEPVIDLPKQVIYRPFALPFPFRKFRFICRGRVRAWVGYTEEDDGSDADDDEMVYVTEHESVYHTSSACTHLDLSWEAVPGAGVSRLRNEYGSKYHACEKCVSGGRPAAVVYLSREGDAFHNSPSCSGLTRHVRIVKKSEVENLPECSRCAERDAEEQSG
ncbi:MAG: hypothetical protein LKG40_07115 [Lachnospiraceae bacterium]|jgi:hypothetical protein|nr:hypothetical protein [Lachnospiraceae bacterium]MCI1328611.1 hypothetical protein [Lachnospiraceae bacterium]